MSLTPESHGAFLEHVKFYSFVIAVIHIMYLKFNSKFYLSRHGIWLNVTI